jgi:hypothetical protein
VRQAAAEPTPNDAGHADPFETDSETSSLEGEQHPFGTSSLENERDVGYANPFETDLERYATGLFESHRRRLDDVHGAGIEGEEAVSEGEEYNPFEGEFVARYRSLEERRRRLEERRARLELRDAADFRATGRVPRVAQAGDTNPFVRMLRDEPGRVAEHDARVAQAGDTNPVEQMDSDVGGVRPSILARRDARRWVAGADRRRARSGPGSGTAAVVGSLGSRITFAECINLASSGRAAAVLGAEQTWGHLRAGGEAVSYAGVAVRSR